MSDFEPYDLYNSPSWVALDIHSLLRTRDQKREKTISEALKQPPANTQWLVIAKRSVIGMN